MAQLLARDPPKLPEERYLSKPGNSSNGKRKFQTMDQNTKGGSDMKDLIAKIGFGSLSFLVLFFIFLTKVEAHGTKKVDCDKGKSIQEALDKARDGDVIEVEGTCSENIAITKNQITLRGMNGAIIDGPDTTITTIRIEGLSVRIEDFASIRGGSYVIQVRMGGSARIDDNTIEGGTKTCIKLSKTAYARIRRNTIQNCSIHGINVRQSSSADIFSNTISGHGSRGIQVSATGAADIAGNTITDNGSTGIRVRRTSHIRLSDEPDNTLTNVLERNGRFGIRCQTNSSIAVGTAQTYGVGADANASGDSTVSSSCRVVGGTL